MKKVEKEKAREMRSQGMSMKDIAKALGVAKGSVSVWVRDIELTLEQRKRLSEKGHSFEVIEKRRKVRLNNVRAQKQKIVAEAAFEVGSVSERDLLLFGIAAYWGGGAKRKMGSVEFFNSDPRFIKTMMRFFKDVCHVPASKFKGRIHLHRHLDVARAEEYWSKVSGIPRSQFQKTAQQQNTASTNKKDTLPYGTFMIGVYDTRLLLRISGWIEGVCQWAELPE